LTTASSASTRAQMAPSSWRESCRWARVSSRANVHHTYSPRGRDNEGWSAV
jgi:hypothetical protein